MQKHTITTQMEIIIPHIFPPQPPPHLVWHLFYTDVYMQVLFSYLVVDYHEGIRKTGNIT